jgi:hypothetical protein
MLILNSFSLLSIHIFNFFLLLVIPVNFIKKFKNSFVPFFLDKNISKFSKNFLKAISIIAFLKRQYSQALPNK